MLLLIIMAVWASLGFVVALGYGTSQSAFSYAEQYVALYPVILVLLCFAAFLDMVFRLALGV